MKPIVIQYRTIGVLGAILLVLFAAAGAWRFSQGDTWYSVLLLVAFGAFSGCSFLRLGQVRHIFSEDGIHAGSIGKNRFYPWDQVIQAGILLNRNNACPCIALTFTGGTPRKRGQNPALWELRNSRTGLLVSCSPELHQLVLHCYGPLDFDLWNNPEETSTVVD